MSVIQMNTTNGVVVRDVLLDQSNYAEFRDFIKRKMEEEKIEDKSVEICFRVVKTVEMVEFTTPARKNAALEEEEERQLTAIEENFVRINKTRVDLYEAMPDGTLPRHWRRIRWNANLQRTGRLTWDGLRRDLS